MSSTTPIPRAARAWAYLFVLLLAACSGRDGAKTPEPTPPPPPVAGAELEFITIEDGKPSLAVGEAANFRAVGHYDDGSNSTLSGVTWRSLNTNLVSVSGGGVQVLDAGFGYAFIEAEYEGRVATAKLSLYSTDSGGSCEAGDITSITFHYRREDNNYDDWGLHLWGEDLGEGEGTTWEEPKLFTGLDGFGAVVNVAVTGTEDVNFIVHRGDEKDPDGDRKLPCGHSEVWLLSGDSTIYTEEPQGHRPAHSRARWISPSTLVWEGDSGSSYTLHYSADAELAITGAGVSGGESLTLTADGSALHLAADDLAKVPEILRGQVWLASSSGAVTGVQIQGVLDDLYHYDGELGPVFDNGVPSLAVWAPTAQSVRLRLFPDSESTSTEVHPMLRDDESGVWSITGSEDWYGRYYLYEVQVYVPLTGRVETNLVTDPYSVTLATNSARSQIIDLDDADWKPEGWDQLQKPALEAPEDIVLYELHLRDFSASAAELPEEMRGKFRAFTAVDSNGMRHLRELADAGLTHVHLLPVFDIASVNEDPAQRQEPGDLSGYAPDSEQQQAAVAAVKDRDAFNWGYDPLHFGAPEGSYASDADGPARILEFREMVQGLHRAGLRVVMDVVYNHTSASGMWLNSVLDRIVPGYYHRLDGNGKVQRISCCDDTASEYRMMEKLMVDTLVRWARDYKVDGFRFDLMGLHTRDNIALSVRNALDQLTMEAHGTDGSSIYLYGEGWNVGGLPDTENMTQTNAAGTGVGSFNDRIRNAITGGIHDYDVWNQGFATGNFDWPVDMVKAGLAGNLSHWGGQAYGEDPQENIAHVSVHDNYTLWDMLAIKLDTETPASERIRVHQLATDMILVGQGIPFLHAGVEMLRSKSGDRNSYNSGDHFNRLDYSYQGNNWGQGLSPAQDNQWTWDWWRERLPHPNMQPTPEQIQARVEHMKMMLGVRKDVKLLRLRTAEQIDSRLTFETPDQGNIDGVLMMKIHDKGEQAGFDPKYAEVMVVINATDSEQSLDYAYAESWSGGVQLHPLQAAAADLVSGARYQDGSFTVPGKTVAVFVEPK